MKRGNSGGLREKILLRQHRRPGGGGRGRHASKRWKGEDAAAADRRSRSGRLASDGATINGGLIKQRRRKMPHEKKRGKRKVTS